MASLNPTSPALWSETPEARDTAVARVALVAAVDGEYSFAVPDALAGQIEPGRRVLVPFGRSREPQPAFCVAVAREPWTSTLKPVAEVLDDTRLLSDELLDLGRWISRYYATPLGRVLSAMVPEAIRSQRGFRVRRTVCLSEPEPVTAGEGSDASTSGRRTSPGREAVLAALREAGPMELDDLLARTGVSRGVVSAMVKAGLLEIREEKVPAEAPDFDRPAVEPTFTLNDAQRGAIERIVSAARDGRFRSILLFGVSGSGKTEVYIHSIRNIVAAGRQAIFLVPEIALTTQLVDRLASRFRDVAVIHSGLTGVQRSLTWAAIARGKKKVIIGTRSAVFAPCPSLGLIIVDEEQEGSYKNQQSPRFHTRDVAIKRAQMSGIPVVLGSATPSLETWYNCTRYEHFERVPLPSRIAGLAMPSVEFVDMQDEARQRKGIHLLSMRMETRLKETLAAGQQAVLLLNRRGYASYLVCSRCRTPVVCPNCRANMVFHQSTGRALCHHCNAKMLVPNRCGDASCGGTLIRFGMGTQRVEEELQAKFPDARIARADSDVLTKVSQYERVVRDFQERRLDILIGTQMVAKGLDFPFVSFVGVVNADTSMSAPDFRAAERTFQMITQVAGRAGRAGTGGRVVVQTLGRPPAALQFAAHHDYEGFAAYELDIRRRLSWPPFSRLARVIVSHRSPMQAETIATGLVDAVREHIRRHGLKADVLGPQSAPVSRIRNLHRQDFLIRSPSAARLLETIEHLRGHDVLTPNTRFALVDVDPVSLL